MSAAARSDMQRVFIVGCPRSGTTLVQSLLAAHSQVTSFTESHFFDRYFVHSVFNLYHVRDELLDRVHIFMAENNIEQEPFNRLFDESWSSNANEMAKKLMVFFDVCAKSHGKPVWVEKTPDNIFRIPLIEHAAPDAKFIHVIRRPEGVLPSLYNASRTWGHRQRTWTECAIDWIKALKVSKRYFGQPNHYIIFYERLTEDTRMETKRLIEWLGLDWEEALLNNYKETVSKIITKNETWKAFNFDKITNKNVQSASTLPWLPGLLVSFFNYYNQIDACR